MAARAYPCTVELKVVESDAARIKEDFKSRDPDESLAALQRGRTDEGKWRTLPVDRVTCFYAGTLPWMDPGLIAFPAARGDGLIEVCISKTRNRVDLLTVNRSPSKSDRQTDELDGLAAHGRHRSREVYGAFFYTTFVFSECAAIH